MEPTDSEIEACLETLRKLQDQTGLFLIRAEFPDQRRIHEFDSISEVIAVLATHFKK